MKMTKKQQMLLLFMRSLMDVIVFFGIGARWYTAVAFAFGGIATAFYKSWFDPEFEGHMKQLRVAHPMSRRIAYGVYYGSSWPSATWLWFYDHVLGKEA